MDLARRFSPVLVALLAFVAALAVFVAPASPAAAHDALASSDPASGSVLDAAPEAITLTFTGELLGDASANAVIVTDQSGAHVQAGAPRVDGMAIMQPIAPDAGNGAFTVTWRVVSSDGHPISGEFGYLVEAPAVEPSTAPEADASAAPSDAADEASTAPDATAVDGEAQEGEEEGGFRLGIFGILGAVVLVFAIFAFIRTLLRRRAQRGKQG